MSQSSFTDASFADESFPTQANYDDEHIVPPVQALMMEMRFGPDDLEANQQGRLSEDQASYLRQQQRRAVLIGAVAFMILALLATILFYVAQQQDSPILTMLGIALTICNAIMTGILARNWYRINADLSSGQIASQDGLLTRTIRRAGNSSQYLVGIDAVRFSVKKGAFKLFRHEERYTLYYAPTAHILLSAEPKDAA